MIIKGLKFCSFISIKMLGWLVILIAASKLALPFFLPWTLNDTWVEKVVGRYFQEVKIGSVHLVIDDGKLSLLLQHIDTPPHEAQGIHVTRAHVSPSPWKSLWSRKWVFNKITLYDGELHMGFGRDHVRLGAVKIPIHPDQELPVWVHHLNLKHLKVHFDEIDELSELYIHEVHLLNPKQKGLLKAKITEDKSQVAAAQVNFEFEKYASDISGQLYIRGYDYNLTRVFKWLNWPGSTMDGKADYEFWAQVKQGKIHEAVLDLNGEDLTLHKPHGQLDIDSFKGRLGYQNYKHQQRWTGEQLSLKFNDDTLNTEFYILSEPNQDLMIRGSNFDIGLIHFITQDIPQVDTFFQSFDLLPKGNIPFVEMTFGKLDSPPRSVLMRATALSFKKQDMTIDGLDGQLYYRGDTLTAQLQGSHAKLGYDSIFNHPIELNPYLINMHYQLDTQRLNLQAQVGEGDSQIQGSVDLFIQDDSVIDFKANTLDIDAKTLKQWIPFKILKPNVSQWLDNALEIGHFKNLEFAYRGYIKDFNNPDSDSFRLHADLDHIVLDYLAPWPELTVTQGHLALKDHGMQVTGLGLLGSTEAKVSQFSATIPDFRPEKVKLSVKGQIKDDLNTVWDVLHDTTLVSDDLYAQMEFKADMDLALNLGFVFSKSPTQVAVEGHCKFVDGFFGATGLLDMTQMNGEITFNNHGLRSKSLSGYIHNTPTNHQLNLEFGQHGRIDLKSNGVLALQTVLPKVATGHAPFNTVLGWSFAQDYASLRGSMALDKAAIEAPSPLNKALGDAGQLTLAANVQPGKSAVVVLDYEDKMQAQVLFKKHQDQIIPKAATVHFGEPQTILLPDSDYLISGHLAELRVDDWVDFKQKLSSEQPIDGRLSFDLEVDHLISNSMSLDDVKAQGYWSSKQKRAQFAVGSPKLQGAFDLNLHDDGLWKIHLDHLVMNRPVETEQSIQLPLRPFQVKINSLDSEKLKANDLSLSLIPNQDGFVINDLSFKVKNSSVDMTGLWQHKQTPEHVKLAGKIHTNNIGNLLNAIGKPASIRGAKGDILFDIAYKGGLFSPQISSIRGQGDVNLQSGSIPGVNPGIGRILSLLNLDTFQRRLQLDFSDVTHEGYAFDTLEGRFNMSHGLIKSDKLRLEAPTANIDFFGQMGIEDKNVSAEVTVMPNLTGSLPLAAAIAAGNPAVGAAVWLMDKFIGRKIQEMTRYTYIVSGTVDSPQIKEVTENPKKYTKR